MYLESLFPFTILAVECIFSTIFDNNPVCRYSLKQVLLKISPYSQENNYVGAFFNKVACLQANNFIKKRLQHRCFPVYINMEYCGICKSSFFFTEHLWLLFLAISNSCVSRMDVIIKIDDERKINYRRHSINIHQFISIDFKMT